MDLRYGAALEQFASTVDFVDDGILDDFADLLKGYLLEQLPFNFYEILHDERVESRGKPDRGLRTLRVREGREFGAAPVDGGRHNHTAYSYFNNRTLWITAVNEGLLKGAKGYVDSWEKPEAVVDLPAYKSGNPFPIRTSIIQPIRDQEGPCGVINVESKDYLQPNDLAREELERVANAVGTMYLRWQARKLSREGTKTAIGQLPKFGATKRWAITELPKIFVASPTQGGLGVMDAIKEVTGNIGDAETIVWNDRSHNGTGETREDMMTGLRKARAVVCYLSERPDSKSKYRDNPNVLFEAGIADGLHSLWPDLKVIPVREHKDRCETGIPFDIQALTVLEVPRSPRGVLVKKKFEDSLLGRLTWE